MVNAVQHYLTHSAKRFPHKIAVQYHDNDLKESVTWQELDNFTDAFAAHLQHCGVKKGDMIAFFMPKSVSAIKALLSVVKSSAAYIPLDYNSPENRLSAIMHESQSRIVIVNNASAGRAGSLFSRLDGNFEIINIDSFTFDASLSVRPVDDTISVDLAYVLFTSGSTGTPKGVMIPHGAIIDYIDWCVDTYGLTADDQIANHAPLYFDNSTFDIYTALKTGATLHLVPESVNLMIPRLAEWLRTEAISVFFCVPSVLSLLKQTKRLYADMLPAMKQILCAGEVLPVAVLRVWMSLFPHIRFTNMYGPTEITVDCSYHIIDRIPDPQQKHVPIGLARANMEMYVFTDDGKLTRLPGSQGELWVRGLSVACGYLSNPEKTSESFVQNPEHNRFPDLLYKTGDLVFIGDDHLFYYVGRKDSQIKHMGYRIELGEIEASALLLEYIEEAVSVYKNGEDNAAAYIGLALKTTRPVEIRELRQALNDVLPKYMVPGRFLFIDGDYPRTANGKYDRKAIAALF